MRSGTGRTARIRLARLLGACGGVLLAACASDGPGPIVLEQDLFSPNASRRTAAVAVVQAEGETRWLPRLVELLDDRDPAVRAMANQTLEQMTGRTSDYQAYASAQDRREHVRGWEAWLAAREAADGTAPVPTPPVGTPEGVPWSAPRVDGAMRDAGGR